MTKTQHAKTLQVFKTSVQRKQFLIRFLLSRQYPKAQEWTTQVQLCDKEEYLKALPELEEAYAVLNKIILKRKLSNCLITLAVAQENLGGDPILPKIFNAF